MSCWHGDCCFLSHCVPEAILPNPEQPQDWPGTETWLYRVLWSTAVLSPYSSLSFLRSNRVFEGRDCNFHPNKVIFLVIQLKCDRFTISLEPQAWRCVHIAVAGIVFWKPVLIDRGSSIWWKNTLCQSPKAASLTNHESICIMCVKHLSAQYPRCPQVHSVLFVKLQQSFPAELNSLLWRQEPLADWACWCLKVLDSDQAVKQADKPFRFICSSSIVTSKFGFTTSELEDHPEVWRCLLHHEPGKRHFQQSL